jgi:hypothetical protein
MDQTLLIWACAKRLDVVFFVGKPLKRAFCNSQNGMANQQACVVCTNDDDTVQPLQSCDGCKLWFCTSDYCARQCLGNAFDKRLGCGDVVCRQCRKCISMKGGVRITDAQMYATARRM